MKDKLAEALSLPRGAQVLDAGCNVGRVAFHLAENYGLRVKGIDLVEHHVARARQNIDRASLPPGTVTAQ